MPIGDSSNTKLRVLALIKLDIDIPHQIQQQCYKCTIITLYNNNNGVHSLYFYLLCSTSCDT